MRRVSLWLIEIISAFGGKSWLRSVSEVIPLSFELLFSLELDLGDGELSTNGLNWFLICSYFFKNFSAIETLD